MFFCKERKRTQKRQRSFAKNVKERKECNILLQMNAKERRTLHSFEKNVCPLPNPRSFFQKIYIYRYVYINLYWKKNAAFFYILILARFVIFVCLMKPKRVQRSFAFFYKEHKRPQRTQHSFIKNVKECKERHVLL